MAENDAENEDKAILTEAKEAFDTASNWESENRNLASDDLHFARLGEQWDEKALRQRRAGGRPALTNNRLPAFIRQVVNETRQNKPQIRVRPVDGGADMETAEIYNGLIRNIEKTSNADIAYDTAVDFATSMGFGYIRVDVDYSHDDTFDQDIRIERISNPFNVFGDPYSEAADSSDWNSAFYVETIPKKEFERKYKNAEPVDWEGSGYTQLDNAWFSDEGVMVAEWWKRVEFPRKILQLNNGQVVGADVYEEQQITLEAMGLHVTSKRMVKSHKVTHRLMTGAEILETTPWPGRYIPIVPVYGEEVNVKGKRYFRSLIRDAKDPQRMYNYWRTASTELVALAPKAPYIGPEEAFEGTDARKWEQANTQTYSYLGYAGDVPPQRQPFAGVPAGALQESLNAADDMKAIMGIYDPSLGARSNETSGRAIVARQREGDTSTFHFTDNLSRGIRQVGRITIDLIPHVYSGKRMIRVLGVDGQSEEAQLGEATGPLEKEQERMGFERVYDLTVGKYDLVVEAGPSYATQREEAATQMLDLLQVYPQAAPAIGDLLVRNMDWPGSDEIADRLKALSGFNDDEDEEDPRLAQATQMIQQLQGQLRQMAEDRTLDKMKVDIDAAKARAQAQNDAAKNEINAMEAEANAVAQARDDRVANEEAIIKAYDAETKRIAALASAQKDITSAASPPGPADRTRQ